MAAGKLYENGVGWRDFAATDIPASGVTAGTYGDSTHVGQFTVAANGTLTAASSVAIAGGGGGSGLVSLFSSTLGVDTAAIDTGAGGIAGGHGALQVYLILRTDEAGAVSNASLTFNADTGAHYDTEALQANGTTTQAQQINATTGVNIIVHGSGGSASYAGAASVAIPGYDATTFYKTGNVNMGANDATASSMYTILRTFTWQNTAAITRMAITAAGAAKLKAGSSMTIYGTQ